jgi:putative flippase GtrA
MRLSRYVLTGGVAAVVDIGGFAVLSALRVPLVLAAASSFLMATVVNFFLTARWVFYTPTTLRGYILFLSGAMFGASVNVTLTTVGVTVLGLPRIVAKVIAVTLTFLLNFGVNALVVFRIRAR